MGSTLRIRKVCEYRARCQYYRSVVLSKDEFTRQPSKKKIIEVKNLGYLEYNAARPLDIGYHCQVSLIFLP